MADLHDPPASTTVLTNPDLLYGIFTFVPLTQDYRDNNLAPYATVCRTFYEPAARVLWRTLETLLPLWHLLAPPNTPFHCNFNYHGEPHDYDDALKYLQKVNSAQLYLDPIRWNRFR